MGGVKAVFSRFLETIRIKNNNCLSGSNNPSIINNFDISNNNNDVNIPGNPSGKMNKLQLLSLKKSTFQQYNQQIKQKHSPNSPFACTSVFDRITVQDHESDSEKRKTSNSVYMSKSDGISWNQISHEENIAIGGKRSNVHDNILEKNEAELLAQTMCVTMIGETEVEAKEKKRKQPHSSPRPASHFNCCYQIQSCGDKFNCSNIDSRYQLNSLNKIFTNSSYNINEFKDNLNTKNSGLFIDKNISNTPEIEPIFIKLTNSSQINCSHRDYSPTPFRHRIHLSRPNSSISPPLTLRQLSTVRSRYEQSEYCTENESTRKCFGFLKNSPVSQDYSHQYSDELSITNDKATSPFAIPSPVERPRFYSSNLITLSPTKYSDGTKLKYITEQLVLAKSVVCENKTKVRSYSWSKYPSVNKESDESGSPSNEKDETEYKEPESGRPSDCEFNIPFHDIKLVECLLKGERKAIYKGYWHGEVDVHIFENLNRAERRGFWQDVTRLMMTRHENIALFMGVCVEPPNFAIVTSSCTSISLYTKLHIKLEKLSHSTRLHLLRQIAHAITYLHSRTHPIVIRRLSSKNIFLKPKMNLYLTDYSTEDCDYQVPGFIPVPVDGMKYIAPELLVSVEEEIVKLCGQNCKSTDYLRGTSETAVHTNNDDLSTTGFHSNRYRRLTKKPILGYIRKLSYSSELQVTDNDIRRCGSFKSWPNLMAIANNPHSLSKQITRKYASFCNLSNSFQTFDDAIKLPYKSVKYISLRKTSFIKTIRQFCSSSEKQKVVVKTLYVPVTEFTTFTDVFAFGTIIFELNTRCFPFEDLDVCEYIQRLRAGQRDDGSAYCIPNYLKILMLNCWSGNPTRRPPMSLSTEELIKSHIVYKRQNSDPVPKRSIRYPINGF
ncbi:unnamed protein product [Heterobilharzia americana]|nr:unnamed protein product [Heterobilharzia americana]